MFFLSNGQETCRGLVNDESPLDDVEKSDDEMMQCVDDIQECVPPSTTVVDVDLILDTLK